MPITPSGQQHGLDSLSFVATALDADIYAAPFHVQGTVDPLHPNFRGQLPPTTKEINQVLSGYDTMLLVGEKVDTFTYDGRSALPSQLQVIQIAPATSQLGFDYPCDIAVLGEIRSTLDAIAAELEADASVGARRQRTPDVAALEAKYSPSGKRPSDALILAVLRHLDLATHVITEGSSEDAIVQDMAVRLGFRNVHFSPRGGGLGWAMPLGVGIGLATRQARRLLCRGWRQPLLDPRALDSGQVPYSVDIHLFCKSRISIAEGPLVQCDGDDDRNHALRRYGLRQIRTWTCKVSRQASGRALKRSTSSRQLANY